jgi:hypothetical protein
MTSYWLLLLIPITFFVVIVVLDKLGVIPDDSAWSTVADAGTGAAAFLLGVMTFGLLSRGRGKGGKGKLTAGDVADDQTDAIDEKTTEDIENAPTDPDPDYAADTDGVMHDAADEAGTELGDGFSREPLVDTNDVGQEGAGDDSEDVPWPDDLLPVDADD